MKENQKKIAIGILILIVITAAIVVWWGSTRKTITVEDQALQGYKDALPQLRKELEADPNNVELNNEYAYSLYVTQDQEAIEAYKKTIELDPSNDRALNNLGNLYRKTQQYQLASETYTQAITQNPQNLNAYINKAHLYLHDLQQPEEGYKTLEEAITANPSETILHLVLAKAYEQANQTEKARESYANVLKIDPEHPVALEKVR